MTASDLAAVVAAVLALAVAAALAATTVWLVQGARALRVSASRATRELQAALDELDEALRAAEDQLDRSDAVLETLDAVSRRVDATSSIAYDALSRPVIRAVSIGSGTARAARRLRRRQDATPEEGS